MYKEYIEIDYTLQDKSTPVSHFADQITHTKLDILRIPGK